VAIYGHLKKKMFLGNLGPHILFLKYFKQNGENWPQKNHWFKGITVFFSPSKPKEDL